MGSVRFALLALALVSTGLISNPAKSANLNDQAIQAYREARALSEEFLAQSRQFRACRDRFNSQPSNRRGDLQAACPSAHVMPIYHRAKAAYARAEQLSEQGRIQGEAVLRQLAERDAAKARQQSENAASARQKPAKVAQAGGAASGSGDRIISGNWATSCQQTGNRIVCQRYGGFLNNVFPAGCEANNLLICEGRSLCSLASEVTIVQDGNYRKLQPGLEGCTNRVRRPPT